MYWLMVLPGWGRVHCCRHAPEYPACDGCCRHQYWAGQDWLGCYQDCYSWVWFLLEQDLGHPERLMGLVQQNSCWPVLGGGIVCRRYFRRVAGDKCVGWQQRVTHQGEATAVGGAGISDELDVVLVDDEEVVEGMEDLSLAF